MIDTTKWTGFTRWCAVGFLAAALGGRTEPSPEPIPRVRVERVAPDADSPSPGVVLSGERQVVLGHVDPGSEVARDTIALTALSPCVVRYRLKATLPESELAVHIIDPTQEGIGRGAQAGVLAFAAAGERRDLEVGSTWGASCFSLELEVLPLPLRAGRAGR